MLQLFIIGKATKYHNSLLKLRLVYILSIHMPYEYTAYWNGQRYTLNSFNSSLYIAFDSTFHIEHVSLFVMDNFNRPTNNTFVTYIDPPL